MRSFAVMICLVVSSTVAPAHDWNGLAIDARGRIYAVDADDGQVWRVSPEGEVEVFLRGAGDDEDCHHFHHLEIDRSGSLWLASG